MVILLDHRRHTGGTRGDLMAIEPRTRSEVEPRLVRVCRSALFAAGSA
jgi:hypothetical protein